MHTPGIAHVTARIREIQSRVEAPAVPGQFRDMLSRSLDAGAEPAPAEVDSDTVSTDHPPVARFQAMQVTTLGMMVGVAAPTAVPAPAPFPGIATTAQLQDYLATNGIEGRNGHLSDRELTPVSGGWHGNARLLPPAAAAWEEMRAAAALDGVELKVIDSYRTWESQARAHEAHLRGEKTANVLPPGHSEHGNGLAVDVTNGSIIGRDDPEWAWLQSHATRFGWFPISNETWHWEFRGINA